MSGFALEFKAISFCCAEFFKHCVVLFCPWVSGVFVELCKIYQTLSCFAFEFSRFLGVFFVQNSSKTFLCAIFQPKGADRKHKTDREKMDKRTEAEKVNCNICNICSLYPNKKTDRCYPLICKYHRVRCFFLYFGSINVRCVIQIHLSIFFLLLGKIPAIIWMYSFDRGDLDFSLFFYVVKDLEYCYHCFIDIHWHQFWWIQKYCWSTFIRWVKISMFLNHIQFSWDLNSSYRNLWNV